MYLATWMWKQKGDGEEGETTTSVLELLSPVVGAVFALHAEVDVGADAAVVQRLDRANVVAHAQEDLRRLVLAQQPQGVHLRWRQKKRSHWEKVGQIITEMWATHFDPLHYFPEQDKRIRQKKSWESFGIKASVPGWHVSREEQWFREKIFSSDRQSPVSFESCVSVCRAWLTCMRVRYTGLFIRIHVAVSKHGGMVIDPSYVIKLLVSG